jgi:hypothetical protein
MSFFLPIRKKTTGIKERKYEIAKNISIGFKEGRKCMFNVQHTCTHFLL